MDWVSLVLGVLKGILKAVGLFQEDLREEKDHAEGRALQTAEAAEQMEADRKRREEIKKDVADDTRAELDQRADKWMRD